MAVRSQLSAKAGRVPAFAPLSGWMAGRAPAVSRFRRIVAACAPLGAILPFPGKMYADSGVLAPPRGGNGGSVMDGPFGRRGKKSKHALAALVLLALALGLSAATPASAQQSAVFNSGATVPPSLDVDLGETINLDASFFRASFRVLRWCSFPFGTDVGTFGDNRDATTTWTAPDTIPAEFTGIGLGDCGPFPGSPALSITLIAPELTELTGTFGGAVTEDGAASATGMVQGTEADGTAIPGVRFSVPGSSTSGYGSFAITPTGVWTYTPDYALAAWDALDDGDAASDMFTIAGAFSGVMFEQVITLALTGANEPLAFTVGDLDDQQYAEGVTITSLTLPPATGGDGDYTYRATANDSLFAGASGGGLRFNGNTRVISGTPTTPNSYTVTYRVTDGGGATTFLRFGITVTGDTAPAFADGVTIPGQEYVAGFAITTLTLPQAGGGNGALSYTLGATVGGTLPAGLTFDADSRELSGIPTTPQAATGYTYTVTDSDVTDPDSATLAFTIEVTSPPVLSAIAGELAGTVTEDVEPSVGGTVQGTEADGTAIPGVQFSVSGSLASGYGSFAITAAGVWTYTPDYALAAWVALDDGDMASDMFTIAATFNGVTVEQAISLALTGANEPLAFTVGDLDDQQYIVGVVITNLILPQATGGDGDYTYRASANDSLFAGASGGGLRFNVNTRVISGTPTTPNSYTVTYRVTDSGSETTFLRFDIIVMADTAPAFAEGVTIPDQQYIAGFDVFVPTPQATGGNGALSYTLVDSSGNLLRDGPTGLRFISNPSNPRIQGTPTVAQDPTDYTYTVTDANGDTATLTFSIEVMPMVLTTIRGTTSATLTEPGGAVSGTLRGHSQDAGSVPGATLGDVTFELAASSTGTTDYGTFVIFTNGDWRFTPDYNRPAWDALAAGSTTEAYTVEGTLDGVTLPATITITLVGMVEPTVIPGSEVRDLQVAVRRRGSRLLTFVSWLPPATVSGTNPVTGYAVQGCRMASLADCATLVTETHNPTPPAGRQEAVFNSSTHSHFRVRAIFSDGRVSPWVSAMRPEGDPPSLGLPAVIRNLAASGITDTGVTLSWDAPATGTLGLQSYSVRRGFPSAPGSRLPFEREGLIDLADQSARTYTDSGLLPGTEYLYGVVAANAEGIGPELLLSVTTTGTAPPPVVISGTSNGDVSEVGTTTGTLDITVTGTESTDFVPISGRTGTYGTFSIDSDGVWVYSPNNSPATLALMPDEVVMDIFTVAAAADPEVTQDVTITITGVNTRPRATIFLLETTVEAGQTLSIAGVRSDPDNELDELIVVWSAQDSVGNDVDDSTFSNPAGVGIEWTPPLDAIPGEYVLTLIVADPGSLFVSRVLRITVTASPLSFGTASIADQNYHLNIVITDLTLPAAIGGAGPYSYALPDLPSGLSFDGGTRVLSGTPDTVQAATTYTYTATDSASPPAMETLEFTIEVAAATATISATSSEPLTEANLNGATLTVTLAGTAYEDSLPANSITLNTEATNAGVTVTADRDSDTQATLMLAFNRATSDFDDNLDITVTVLDAAHTGTGNLVTGAETVTAVVESSDATLSGLSLSGTTLNEVFAPGTTVYTADVASDVATLAVTPTANDDGATITVNDDPVSSGTASSAIDLIAGANIITVEVTAEDGSTQTYTLTVTREQPPAALSFGGATILAQTYTMDTDIPDLTLPVATGGTAPYSYGLSDVPSGLSFNDGSRVLSGTPDTVQVATPYTYTATDAALPPAMVTLEFTIEVTAVPVVIGGATTGTVTEDRSPLTIIGTLTVTTASSNKDFVEQSSVVGIYGIFDLNSNGDWFYTLNNADPNTNALTAGATAEDVFTVAAAANPAATAGVTITVNGANDRPTATISAPAAPTSAMFGAAVTVTGSGTDPDAGETASLSHAWTTAPPGQGSFAAPNAASTTWTAGAPAIDDVVTLTLTVTDTSSAANASHSATVAVTVTAAPVTISGPDTGAVTEDDPATATNTLAIANPNPGGVTTFVEQTGTDGSYGLFEISSVGVWTYTLGGNTPNEQAVNALAAGATPTDVFTVVASADRGVTQVVTITVNGANDRPTATISAPAAPTSAMFGTAVTVTGSGTDPDAGETASLSHAWTTAPPGQGSFAAPNAASTTWTAGAPAIDDVVTLTLTVTDTSSAANASHSATVAVTVTAAPVTISGPDTGAVTEDDPATATNTLAIANPNPGGVTTFVAQTGTDGSYGLFSITSAGVWTYTLGGNVPNQQAVNALPAGATPTDVFTVVASADSSVTQVVTITVNGANDQPTATISAPAAPTSAIFGAAVTVTGSGTDPDAGETASLSHAWTTAPPGQGSFAAPNAASTTWTAGAPAIDDVVTLTLTVTDTSSAANASHSATVAVTVTAAPITISGPDTGAVTEDDPATATNTLAIANPNPGGVTTFVEQTGTDGSYGLFSITSAGVWTYTLGGNVPNQQAVNALAAGATPTDVFTVVASADSSVTQVVTITVNGANDQPTATISAPAAPTSAIFGAAVTVTGSGTDPDAGETASLSHAWTTAPPGQGSFAAPNAASTTWTAGAPAIDDVVTLTLTVTDTSSAANASHSATVAVTVTAAPITISGPDTGAVTEDDPATATNTLAIANPNPGGVTTFVEQTGTDGSYGLFSITSAGVWTYTLGGNVPNEQAVNALAAGATPTDTFTVVASADGSVTQDVSITVNGANDAPTATITAPTAGNVEFGVAIPATGTGTDPDTTDVLSYAWTTNPVNRGTFANANAASTMWTAPASDTTAVTLMLTVTDDATPPLSDTAAVTVNPVAPPPDLSITAAPMVDTNTETLAYTVTNAGTQAAVADVAVNVVRATSNTALNPTDLNAALAATTCTPASGAAPDPCRAVIDGELSALVPANDGANDGSLPQTIASFTTPADGVNYYYLVCVTVDADTDCSPYSTAVNVAAPLHFSTDFVADQVWRVNEPVEEQPFMANSLSGGSGGGYTYALSPIPPGVTFDSMTRRLSGTPTGIRGPRLTTLTGMDSDGTEVELMFMVSIVENRVRVTVTANGMSGTAFTFPEDVGTIRLAVTAELLPAGSTRRGTVSPVMIMAADGFGLSAPALQPDDYLRETPVAGNPALEIPEGVMSRTWMYDLEIVADSVVEFDEMLLFNVSVGGLRESQSIWVITITDPRTASIELTLSPSIIYEDSGSTFGGVTPVVATVRSLTTLARAVDISLSAAGGTAEDTEFSVARTDSRPLDEFGELDQRVLSITRELTITPVMDTVSEGDETVILTASGTGDDAGITAMATLTIRDGMQPDSAPVLSGGINDQRYSTVAAIEPVTLPIATGGNGPLRYSIAPELPAGLSFDDATRVLSGTATSAGTDTFTYTAHDTDSNTADSDAAALSFMIQVIAPLTFGSDPVLPSALTFLVDEAVNITLPDATGTGTGAITYAITETLPNGLSFTAASRVLSGTPTLVQPTTTYTYTATDTSPTTVELTFSITINVADVPGDGSTTTRLMVPGTLDSDIESVTDEDGFLVALVLGGTYQIDAMRTSGNLDTGIALFPPGQASFGSNCAGPPGSGPLAENDDFAGGNDSRITYTATQTADHLLCVQGSTITQGNYRLTAAITAAPPPMPTAAIASPASLTEATLEGATVTVMLANTEYVGTLAANLFSVTLSGGAAGVSVSAATRTSEVLATLTLAYGGTGIDADTTLGITVLTAAHSGAGDLGTATIPVTATPPSLTGATFSVAENTAAATTVGTPLVPDNFPTGTQAWAIVSGNTGGDFAIDAVTGQLAVAAGDSINFEDTASYTLVVSLTVGAATEQATVTLTVDDVEEPPSAPAAPTVAAATESLIVSWTAPANSGPAITGYDVRYRVGSTGAYTDAADPGTATSLTITGLTAATLYEVQVRAVNAEGMSAYSAPGTGTPLAVGAPTAAISATDPVSLTEANLDGAMLTVTLSNATYTGTLTASQFTLTGAPGAATISVASVMAVAGSDTQAVLELAYTGADLDSDLNLGVVVAAAAHTGTNPLTTAPVTVADNAAPEIINPGRQSYVQNAPITALTITVNDADGDADGNPPTVTLTNLPNGLMFDGTNQVTGTPTALGDTVVTITADDGVNDIVTATFTITVTPSTGALSFGGETIDAQTYTVNTAIADLTLPVAGGGTAPYSYALSDMPSGLSFDDGTRVLSGTPDAAQAATTYTYTATDSAISPAAVTLDLVITVNAPPAFEAQVENQVYTLNLAITDLTLPAATGGTGTLSYSLARAGGGPFPGLAFDTDTRIWSGAPTEQTIETMLYTVTDAFGSTDTQTFLITVNAPFGLDGTIADQTYTVGVPVSLTLPMVTDGAVPPVAYSLIQGVGALREFPPGLTFTANTRVLAGEPTMPHQRLYIYGAQDSVGAVATQTFIITVLTPSLPDTMFTVVESVAAGTAVGAPLVPANFPPGTQAWVIVSGNTGDDFAIDEVTGQLSVAADDSINFEDTASYTLMVSLMVGAATAQATVTVTVTDVEEPPLAPAAPTVTAAAESLNVNWTAPDNNGPAITGYDVEYRLSSLAPSGAYTDAGHSGTTPDITITGLTASVEYQVRVRATNAEGDGPYSALGSGTPLPAGAPTAAITTTDPLSLTEANLDGAMLTVTLTNATYTGTLMTSQFRLTVFSDVVMRPVLAFTRGILVESVMAVPSSNTQAVLELSYTGADLDSDLDLSVVVVDTAHTGTNRLGTAPVTVADNVAPEIINPGRQSYVQNAPITALTITVNDADGDGAGTSPTVTLTNLPNGLLFDGTDQVTGTPTELGDTVVTITADDGVNDRVTETFTITVTSSGGALSFSVATIAAQTYTMDTVITDLTLPVATGGTGTLSYTLSDVPSGLSFSATTRVLSGTPDAAQALTTYTYTATDAAPATVMLEFTIEVVPALSFSVATIAAQTYTMDTVITDLTLPVATGGTGTLSYTLSDVPSGLSFSATTRVLSGTPDAAQATTTYTYTATDAATPPAAVTLNLVITVVAPATPTISGALTGTLVEDAPTPTATGMLTITNPGSGSTEFTPQTDILGTYGDFSIVAGGGWSYTLNNGATATDALAAGATVTDTFDVSAVNAAIAPVTVTISITGANDAPTATASATPLSVASGGTVALTGGGVDPDTGAALVFQWSAAGNVGTFTNADMANAGWDAPRLDSTASIVITLTVSDGTASASATVDIEVMGNRPSVIGGGLTGTASVSVQTATGTLTSTDPDGPDNMFRAESLTGTYGTLVIMADGTWSYTLGTANPATIALAAAQMVDDVLTISAADGTTATLTITVTGANDAPVAAAGGDQRQGQGATVTLDGTASSDPDSGASLSYAWAQSSGTPVVTLSGQATATATFTAPELSPGTDSLELGFTLTVTDGTATVTDTVSITITNEPSVIGGDLSGRVSENAPTAMGTLTSSDPDGPDNMFMAADDLAGTYGTLDITETGAWSYTLDLTDDDTVELLAAGQTGEDAIMISAADGTAATITIRVGQREEARREAMEMTLGAFGRSFASGAVDVLGERFSSGAGGSQLTFGGRTLSLESLTNDQAAAGAEPDNQPVPASAGGQQTSVGALFAGSAFQLSLNEGDAAGVGATTLWARGAVGNYEGEPEDGFQLDGDIVSGYLGLDYRASRRMLVGVAVSHSRGDADFSSADIADGEVETELTSILPYVQWKPHAGLSLWGLVGYGLGESEITDSGESTKTDVEMQTAALGARGRLWSGGRADVALKVSALTVEIESDSEQNLSSVTTRAHRLRMALEGNRHGVASARGGRFGQRFELGLRWDLGDVETGAGADLGAGVEYANPRSGTRLRLDGHYLLVHEETDFEAWEVSAEVGIAPSLWGRGVRFALQPGWDSAGARQRMVMDFTDVLGPAWRGDGLKLELYGEHAEDHEFGLEGSVRY